MINQFRNKYANWEKLNSVCITFDIDFAPDFMIQNVINILEDNNLKATFFTTHFSELIKNLERSKNIEIAIHPNLSANSTQGKGLEEIVANLLSFYPSVIGNRFHLLKFSYRDLQYLSSKEFEYDVSCLKFNCPYVLPAFHPDLKMNLYTYIWEDGVCEETGLQMNLNSINLSEPGMKIINFHPMNVYINGSDNTPRKRFLSECKNLVECDEKTANKYRTSGDGAEKVLLDLAKFVSANSVDTYTLSSVNNEFNKARKYDG